jgi:competence protein ComEA
MCHDGHGTANSFITQGGLMKMMPTQTRLFKTLCLILLLALAAAQVAIAMETVNINTATAKQLMQLDRVGAKYADRIVEYREKNGPFKAPQDIMKVKGIGKKTWQANKDRIIV